MDFAGYHRLDGRIGVRNYLLVLSLAGLTGPTARRVGSAIAGAVTIAYPYGSGLLGRDREVYVAALKALPAHPNVGATVLIGDNPPLVREIAVAAVATGKPCAHFTMDDCGQDAITLTERVACWSGIRSSDLRRATATGTDVSADPRARMWSVRSKLRPCRKSAARADCRLARRLRRQGDDRRDNGMARSGTLAGATRAHA